MVIEVTAASSRLTTSYALPAFALPFGALSTIQSVVTDVADASSRLTFPCALPCFPLPFGTLSIGWSVVIDAAWLTSDSSDHSTMSLRPLGDAQAARRAPAKDSETASASSMYRGAWPLLPRPFKTLSIVPGDMVAVATASSTCAAALLLLLPFDALASVCAERADSTGKISDSPSRTAERPFFRVPLRGPSTSICSERSQLLAGTSIAPLDFPVPLSTPSASTGRFKRSERPSLERMPPHLRCNNSTSPPSAPDDGAEWTSSVWLNCPFPCRPLPAAMPQGPERPTFELPWSLPVRSLESAPASSKGSERTHFARPAISTSPFACFVQAELADFPADCITPSARSARPDGDETAERHSGMGWPCS
mmetsp:Transcript_39847/g.127695  ORF Transcript_39847/g.127695 Transcript_39847/m.127695 type:complete len:366 (-) Transcript_39847:438-1535(-)